ncbi:MAG: hypothetical protein JO126_00485 [Alphaproteobacteria bacterium]|nr:hypothetical protein [Alphaproteobacteria bacterium]MBV8547916.1 hypothetical protein [Alphaproteobacteria bacterium]
MAQEEGDVFWLSEMLSLQKRRIGDLLKKLGRFVNLGNLKPAILARLERTLEQVAVAKEKEVNLFQRVEALEQLHRTRRKKKLLVHADEPAPEGNRLIQEEAPQPPRKNGLLYLLWYYLLMDDGPKNNK